MFFFIFLFCIFYDLQNHYHFTFGIYSNPVLKNHTVPAVT